MKAYDLLLVAFLILVTLVFICYQQRKPLTSQKFLATTYSYIVLAILLTWFILKVLEKRHYLPNYSHLFVAFVIMIVCIIGCGYSSTLIFSHLFWLLLIVAMATTMYIF